MGFVLGQAGGGSSGGVLEAVVWILVLVAACVVLGVVLMRVRRHYFGEDDASSAGVLPVAELRRMRDRGELSEEEYRRAVDVLAGRAISGGGAGRSSATSE